MEDWPAAKRAAPSRPKTSAPEPEALPGCDWLGMVFAHVDVASIFSSFLLTIEDVATIGGVCRTLRNKTRNCLKTNKAIWRENTRRRWGNVAASQDNLRMMRYARDRGLLDPSWVSSAAGTGCIRVLQWLHHGHKMILAPAHAASAARNGQLEALQWIVAHGSTNLKGNFCVPIEAAASEGEIECLKWMLENMQLDCQPLIPAMQSAAKHGHVACMDLLWDAERPRSGRVALNVMMCNHAAANGHLRALAWLHERNAPWSEGVASVAAGNGHLDCLKYAVAHGLCAGEEGRNNALTYAALGCQNRTGPEIRTRPIEERVACFKYLVDEVGAEITNELVNDHVGQWPCVELVDFCAYRGRLPPSNALENAAKNNWEELVACLRRHRVPWPRCTVSRLLKNKAWGALTTALRHGAPVDFGAKYAVARYDLTEGAQILKDHGHTLDDLDGLMVRVAVENNAKGVAEWLLNNDIQYIGRQWQAWELSAKEHGHAHINETHALVDARQPRFFLHAGR